jgi:uncharacterized membrane protein YdcZ (DUF606 family)
MSDRVAARLRTWWPLLVGHLAAWLLVQAAPLVAWLAAAGVEITAPQAAVLVGFVLAGVVWETGRWLESRVGEGRAARMARWVGRWLVAVGRDVGSPIYPTRT